MIRGVHVGIRTLVGKTNGRMIKIKPVLTTSRGILYKTDCMNLFSAIKEESIDCIFADPPFNLGKFYGNGKEKFEDEWKDGEYLKWCYSWLDECVRVIRPGGAIFIYNLPQWAFHLASHLESKRMMFRHWIALSMKGTFPRGNKLYPAHYALLYFTNGIPKTFNRVRLPIPVCRHCGKDQKDYGGHRKYLNPAGLNLTDFWEDTSPSRHSKFKTRWHINELKPMLPGRCFQIATQVGDVVLDPFGGGGSSYEAAQELKRHWLGSEIVTDEAIIERFERKFPNQIDNEPSKKIQAVFQNPTSSLEIEECRPSLKRATTTVRKSASHVLV